MRSSTSARGQGGGANADAHGGGDWRRAARPRTIQHLVGGDDGTVEKLVVREGTQVAKNDLVVQLDERPARMALDRAKAAYARLIAKPRARGIRPRPTHSWKKLRLHMRWRNPG